MGARAVQACVIHLIRNTFRFASRKYWEEMSRDISVYTAPSETVARERFAEFDAKWGKTYRAISELLGERLERASSRSWTTTSRSGA